MILMVGAVVVFFALKYIYIVTRKNDSWVVNRSVNPCVIAYLCRHGINFNRFDFIVENVGNGVAYDIFITINNNDFQKTIKMIAPDAIHIPIEQYSFIENNIHIILPKGKLVLHDYINLHDIPKEKRNEILNLNSNIELTISYSNAHKELSKEIRYVNLKLINKIFEMFKK